MTRARNARGRRGAAGTLSRRTFVRGAAALTVALPLATGWPGRLLAPRRVYADGLPITLDTSLDPLEQGYLSEGTAPYLLRNDQFVGDELVILDQSSAEHRLFYKVIPEIPTSAVAVEVSLRIESSGLVLDGMETGVHVVISDGLLGAEIRAACIQTASAHKIAIQLGPGGFSRGIPLNWENQIRFRLERTVDGDAILSVGAASETIPVTDLPAGTRSDPTFELGCFSNDATAIVHFGPIGLPAAPYELAVALSQLQLFPRGAEKVQLEGSLMLAAASDGIDPAADGLALNLRLPGAAEPFYPGYALPVLLEPTATGWAIGEGEQARTGIQALEIERTAAPRLFTLKLVDTRTGLTADDYGTVLVDLSIGNDAGTADEALVSRNGLWNLA